MAAPTITEPRSDGEPALDPVLHLLVVGPNLSVTHQLQPGTSLLIGRAEDAPVRLLDPQASRHHACLHVAAVVEIEDLGSANGTRVRDRLIPAHTRIPVEPGEAATIGDTVLTLQKRLPDRRARQPQSHAAFEGRLIEECARAEATQGGLGVLRLRLPGAASCDAIVILMNGVLRPGDVLASFGPRELEVLFPDSDAAQVRALTASLLGALEGAGEPVRSGLALFPSDGTSPQALLSAANNGVLGGPPGGPRGAEAAGAVVRNAAMRALYAMAERAARSPINVLILGETGVGKEVLAQTLAAGCGKSGRGLVSINCAALAETLLESELFGHEKGAFTGATQAKPGLLEAASGGSVFLDEIGEMSLALQAKLLRVIESQEVLRVGSTTPRPIKVRFVAATNRDLEEEVSARSFRSDLYFRLNGLVLTVPPLRERVDEIEPLARHFVGLAARQLGRPAPEIDGEALRLLRLYAWPGNIRELRNVMERAVLLCDDDRIGPDQLPNDQLESSRSGAALLHRRLVAGGREIAWRDRVGAGEREAIVEALSRCGGNQTRAAELLGMPRRTFCARLREYNILRPRSEAVSPVR
jgi:two-component system, NtrC family, response regulator AtoC